MDLSGPPDVGAPPPYQRQTNFRAAAVAAAVFSLAKVGPSAFAAAAGTLSLRSVSRVQHELPHQIAGNTKVASAASASAVNNSRLAPLTMGLMSAVAVVAASWKGQGSSHSGRRCRAGLRILVRAVAGPQAVVADDLEGGSAESPTSSKGGCASCSGKAAKGAPQTLPAGSAPEWREKHWFPVASALELDPKRPTPVRIDGIDLVVWQVPGLEEAEDGGWRIMLDACPHRLAPLSEGRIEPKTGCLQCAYHGWEFDSTGGCTSIPQVDEEASRRIRENPRSKARSFPTALGLNLIWVWLGDSPPKGEPRDIVTGTHLEKEFAVFGTYTRDLPYGYDSLIENLIDVSHVPFAHHGLQGTREDASVITMAMPTVGSSEENSGILDFTFGDKTMGMTRQASFSLRSPFFFFYDGEFVGDQTEEYKKFAARRGTEDDGKVHFRLTLACIPVSPGWSRTIILDSAIPGKEGLRGKIPPWLSHLLSNRFLDSDLAFLHYQERNLRRSPNSASDWSDSYFMPGEGDRSISAWRQWLSREGARVVSPEQALPPSAASREELFNHFEQHTASCKDCSAALDGIEFWQRAVGGAGVVALILDRLALGPTQVWLAAEVLAIAALVVIQFVKQQFYFSDYQHHKT